jgi:tetratricopeptide (TPR) repeat protein
MTHTTRSFAALTVFLLVFGTLYAYSAEGRLMRKPASAAAAAPDNEKCADQLDQYGPHLTLWQARKIVVMGFQVCTDAIVGDPRSFKFTLDSFEFNAKLNRHNESEHYRVDLKTLPQIFPKRGFAGIYRLKDENGKDLPDPFNHLLWQGSDSSAAPALANALNRLREMAGEQGMSLRNFPQAAAAWRALSQKPPVPEEVRAQRLLAETAFKEGNLGKALHHYELGMELYPVWPEGHFNAALISAELKFYNDAVEHMRAYLELEPDSRDAQSARDQIVIWQDKAQESAAATEKKTEQDQPQGRLKKRK